MFLYYEKDSIKDVKTYFNQAVVWMAVEYNVSIVKKSPPETSQILHWLSCAGPEAHWKFSKW